MSLTLLVYPEKAYCGGSVDGAASLATGKADIAFNWSGACGLLAVYASSWHPPKAPL